MVMGLAMLDKGKHFPQSYARMLFSAVGIHQDGQLLITIDPWDERRARELMQEELMLRLYNHVYADPVYWNNLGVEDRIFQLASAIAVVEPDAVFCGSTAALLYGIGSAYTLLDKVQVLLPRSTRRDTYEFVEYKRWRVGEVWRLGLFTLTDPFERLLISLERAPFVMRWAMSMAWPVSTMANAKSCGHMRRQIAEGCMASRVLLTFLSIWTAGQTMAASPRREQR